MTIPSFFKDHVFSFFLGPRRDHFVIIIFLRTTKWEFPVFSQTMKLWSFLWDHEVIISFFVRSEKWEVSVRSENLWEVRISRFFLRPRSCAVFFGTTKWSFPFFKDHEVIISHFFSKITKLCPFLKDHEVIISFFSGPRSETFLFFFQDHEVVPFSLGPRSDNFLFLKTMKWDPVFFLRLWSCALLPFFPETICGHFRQGPTLRVSIRGGTGAPILSIGAQCK